MQTGFQAMHMADHHSLIKRERERLNHVILCLYQNLTIPHICVTMTLLTFILYACRVKGFSPAQSPAVTVFSLH